MLQRSVLLQVCSGPYCNGRVLPASRFSLSRVNLDGLTYVCKICNNAHTKDRLRFVKANPYAVSTPEPMPATVAQQQDAPQLSCHYCGDSRPAAEIRTQPNKQPKARRACSDCRFWRQEFRQAAQKRVIARQAALYASSNLLRIRGQGGR